MSWNILATAGTIAGIGAESADFMQKNGCKVTIAKPFRAQSAAELQRLLPGIQAVYAGPDEFSAELLASQEAAELRIISRWGVGFERIDVDAATAHGIVIAYTPGMLDEAVADYTFALLLGIARRIHTAHATMSAGEWAPQWGHDVHGKTLGIIGCGRIGTAVARRAAGFNLRVLACDPAPNEAAKNFGVEFVPLDSLLAQSDFVSLHAAVTPETKGLIGEAQLKQMKPNAYLINTGRGALVDEAALARALNDGGLAGAAVDAFVEEPLPAEHPFRTAKNLLLAPHQASFSNETGRKVSAACAEAIVDLMNGQRPKMVLNPEVFDSPELRAKLN
jgi:phosphoglycerate dehydrogenase-like enzyme